MKQIYTAFVKAQRDFAPALKSSTNPHFKSRYADLAACVEAVIDSLNANGIGLMQKQHPSEGGVSVETVFVHESGETMSAGILHVPSSKNDAQGYGSALTYARRYSLMAACGIAPEDDDGNAAAKAPSHRVSAPEEGFKMLDDETQTFLRKVAQRVTAAMPDAEKALHVLEFADLDNEKKVGLWHLLDSATRSGIKKAQEARKVAT